VIVMRQVSLSSCWKRYAADEAVRTLGLDHVVLRVSDQDASRRFYTEVLGCSVDHFNERISLLQLRFGEQMIDLLPDGPRPKPRSLLPLHPVRDLESARQTLAGQACESRETSSSDAEPTARGRRCTFAIRTAT